VRLAWLDRFDYETLLLARILTAVLFLVFGWMKLNTYSATAGYMASVGAPFPPLAAIVAIIVESLCGLAIVLGVWTRPVALLLAVTGAGGYAIDALLADKSRHA
jgi:putative oxidoreductase